MLQLTIAAQAQKNSQTIYQPTWNSLKNWRTPQWFRGGKFGIYTHWGVYSVPAQGPNATWYANNLYMNADGPERKYHEITYGPLEKFGYKDFIPMFTGEKFNAEEGPTRLERGGGFNERNDLRYTGQDIRFTVKDNNLYAIALDWPGEKVLIRSLAPKGDTWTGLYASEIVSITMLGDDRELKWEITKEGLCIETPKTKPCDYAFAFKIVRRKPF
jgi:hypothetical protein